MFAFLFISGYIPEMEGAMADAQQSNTTKWRKRRQLQGFVRVEVQVRKEDAGLVRDVASALGDPEREEETRSLLRDKVAVPRTGNLKELLRSIPLDGIEIERQRDFGRDVDL